MKQQNWKTTVVGLLILISLLGSVIMFLVGKITLSEISPFIVVVIGILTGIGFLKSADADNKKNTPEL